MFLWQLQQLDISVTNIFQKKTAANPLKYLPLTLTPPLCPILLLPFPSPYKIKAGGHTVTQPHACVHAEVIVHKLYKERLGLSG